MFDMELEDWRKFTWFRHRWKEEKLMEELGISKGDKYILVNRNYYSFENKTVKINKLPSKIKIIEMDFIDGYNLLDWATTIENAETIHTVNTSIIYLLETLDLRAEKIHLYSRNVKKRDFQQIEYLLSKNYIKHD